MVTGKCNINGNVPTLIQRIRDLKNMSWHVHINHTWREVGLEMSRVESNLLELDSTR